MKNSPIAIDDGRKAFQAAEPSMLDRSVARRLPFFALWFERWKRDCQRQMLTWRNRDKSKNDKSKNVSSDLRAQTAQSEKY
jgi:hypothetical protein